MEHSARKYVPKGNFLTKQITNVNVLVIQFGTDFLAQFVKEEEFTTKKKEFAPVLKELDLMEQVVKQKYIAKMVKNGILSPICAIAQVPITESE